MNITHLQFRNCMDQNIRITQNSVSIPISFDAKIGHLPDRQETTIYGVPVKSEMNDGTPSQTLSVTCDSFRYVGRYELLNSIDPSKATTFTLPSGWNFNLNTITIKHD